MVQGRCGGWFLGIAGCGCGVERGLECQVCFLCSFGVVDCEDIVCVL